MNFLRRAVGVVMLCLGIIPEEYEDCGVVPGYAGERIDDMGGELGQLAVEDVVVRDGWNTRKHKPAEDIRGLQYSMSDVGQLNVISVKDRGDGKYELIAGEKRFLAAQRANKQFVDARVFPKDLSAEQELRIMLDENMVRRELNVIEEAEGFSRMAEFKPVDQIASMYRRSTTYVNERLDLLTLNREVQRLMTRENNPLRIHQALLLVGLPESDQKRIARETAQVGATSNLPEHEVRRMVREARGESDLPLQGEPSKHHSPTKSPTYGHTSTPTTRQTSDTLPQTTIAQEHDVTPEESADVDEMMKRSAERHKARESEIDEQSEDEDAQVGDVVVEGKIVIEDGNAYLIDAEVSVAVHNTITDVIEWKDIKRSKVLLDLSPAEVEEIGMALETIPA